LDHLAIRASREYTIHDNGRRCFQFEALAPNSAQEPDRFWLKPKIPRVCHILSIVYFRLKASPWVCGGRIDGDGFRSISAVVREWRMGVDQHRKRK